MSYFPEVENISTGVYTPSISNVSNLGSSTARECFWTRENDRVIIAGALSITPTSASPTSTSFRIDLPVASNFGGSFELGGVFANGSTNGSYGHMFSVAASDNVEMSFIANTTSALDFYFICNYEVI